MALTYTLSNTSGFPILTRSDGVIRTPSVTADLDLSTNSDGLFTITEDGKPFASFYRTDMVTVNGDAISGTIAGAYTQMLAVLKGSGPGATSAALHIPIGDETTAITTGTAKVTFRMPFAMTVTAVRASLTTASSSGIPTFDINEGGVSILSTKLTIDATETTSTTAATAAVISDPALADDAEITIDFDVSGVDTAGVKIWILGVRA